MPGRKRKSFDSILERHKDKWMPEPTSGCYLWGGATLGDRKRSNNYPSVRVAGKWTKIHRLVCEEVHGKLKTGQVARHVCGNRFCVNPEHIAPGSQSKNMADRWVLHGQKKRMSLPTHIQWDTQKSMLRVRIRLNGRRHELGLFRELEDAIRARDQFRREHNLEDI